MSPPKTNTHLSTAPTVVDPITIPFESNHELYNKLEFIDGELQRAPKQLVRKANEQPKYHLPGHPRVHLDPHQLNQHLHDDFSTADLNRLAPWLWLVAKHDSTHISSLTHQIVRGRQIMVTEDPGLHLTWIYDRVYIKPLPKYLLSYAFWQWLIDSPTDPQQQQQHQETVSSILGFLRSYYHLIAHKSDFALAREKKLLPRALFSHALFERFISGFSTVPDSNVTPRYSYGELRLTRVNFWSKIFLFPRFTYFKAHAQYGDYVARFYGPLLFIFGALSVILSAMQVALQAGPNDTDEDMGKLAKVSRWFSVIVLLILSATVVFLIGLVIGLGLREIVFVARYSWRKRRKKGRI